MPPGESTPEKTAPAPLELVQRFVNSVDLERGEDELTGPAELRDWLAERELIASDARVTRADLERAPDAWGVDGAIGRLLAIVAGAAEQGSWRRLKACPRVDCH